MQSFRGPPLPHGATPSPPTDRSNSTHSSVPSSFHTPESVPLSSSPPFFTMNPLTHQRLTGSMMSYDHVDSHQQDDHVPSTPDRPILADQWQDATQPDTNAVIQNCPCSVCSRTSYADHHTTSGTIEYQDRTLPVESVVPYADQNVGTAYPASVTPTVDFPTQEWSFAPQALYQNNTEYAPLHEVVDPQVQMGTAPNEGALDLSVPERLRCLAGRYVSNPDSTVNGVHLEPGPSGRFQVIIAIDIGDILRDTAN